jgi:hypothetical protein
VLYSLIACFSPELQGRGNPNYTNCKVDLVNHVVLYFLLHFFFSFLHVDLEFRKLVLLVVTLKGKGGKNRKKEKKRNKEREKKKWPQ